MYVYVQHGIALFGDCTSYKGEGLCKSLEGSGG